MRTRCSTCATVFRVTPEQLRIRSGMVRCGHCLAVFNAFDHLVEDKEGGKGETQFDAAAGETPETVAPAPLPETTPVCAAAEGGEEKLASSDQTSATTEAPAAATDTVLSATAAELIIAPTAEALAEIPAEPTETEVAQTAAAAAVEAAATELSVDENAAAEPAAESPEDSTRAAREAGLVAVRDLTDSPAYNRWAAGTLASGLTHNIEVSAGRGARIFTAVAVLLALLLTGQMAYQFRTPLVQRFPDLRDAYAALAIDVPLPRDVEQVSIETSDLQSDAKRGLLVLQATLKNRAAFAQAWPVIELTLTDVNDGILVRRALAAADYLPAGSASDFAARSEIGLKLWLESPHPAAGYRLYVFYP